MEKLFLVAALAALAVVGTASATRAAAKPPQRIVSLSPSATDDLFAIGAGKQVVAVDSFSTYPKQAPTTKLSAYQPNVEAIENYKPDLVVVSEDDNHIVEQLAKLKVKTIVEPAATNLSGVYAELTSLGKATGHTSEAAAVVKRMKANVAKIVRTTPKPPRQLTVYHELDQTYYSVTSKTFIGQLYTLLGIKNIADAAGGTSNYPQLSAEYIIASNPDLIVLADTVCCGQSQATLAARPGWSTISAVKHHEVVRLDDSIASQWGTRVVNFLRALSSAVKTLEAKQQ
ncbi:MAG TPA: ABC transporter substrate-binding protein [Gaiellaceae bacterium]|jgi:iron complex transport system substrate-binding protein|nr:ABC transporter substrate-binding protein [Gaiellaceae bacterium]